MVLVDNYDSFTWNLAHLLDTAGCRVEVVRNDEVTASQVVETSPAGVVISPGPCAPAEAGISVDVVRRCAGVAPVFGICLGHQAIAAAFGAEIVRGPRPVHGQAFAVTHDGGGVLAGLPSPFQATRYHSLIVDERTLPADLVITARCGTLPMGLRHATARAEGVQFHPESILTTHGAAIIRNFLAGTGKARVSRTGTRVTSRSSPTARLSSRSPADRAGQPGGRRSQSRRKRQKEARTAVAMSVPDQQVTVGFVGLGNMGWPMAGNLHAAGFGLVVRDIEAAKQDRFAAEHPGVAAAASPDAFSAAGIVVTMLPNGVIVRDAMLDWGIGAAMRDGALLIEMSSSDPSDTLLLAAGLDPFGIRVVDAPVSGGVPRAVTGELAVMVGGASADVAMAQPVLRVLGDPARQFPTGGLGSGHAMKALNNVIAAATTCVTAEALVVGKRFGLNPKTMIDIINASTGRSFVSGIFDTEVLTGRYGTGFALGLLAKDVHIAASVAAAAGADVPVIALTDERYAKALTDLGPAADQSKAHQAWWDDSLNS